MAIVSDNDNDVTRINYNGVNTIMSTMTTSPRIVLLEETCARYLVSEEVKIVSLSFIQAISHISIRRV